MPGENARRTPNRDSYSDPASPWVFLLSLLIAAVAYRMHSLSPSGVAGAVVTGTLIFGLGGWAWGLLLIAFFCLFERTVAFPWRAQVGGWLRSLPKRAGVT